MIFGTATESKAGKQAVGPPAGPTLPSRSASGQTPLEEPPLPRAHLSTLLLGARLVESFFLRLLPLRDSSKDGRPSH